MYNGCGGDPINAWLIKYCFVRGTGINVTHTLMTGGKYRVDDLHLETLQGLLGDQLVLGGDIPCLTEQHTVVFPLYFDIDGDFSVGRITEQAIDSFMETITMRIKRYYPNEMDSRKFESIVLHKSGKVYKSDASASGLRWTQIDDEDVMHGVRLFNQRLVDDLSQGTTTFRQEQWDEFNITGLQGNHVIQVGDAFMQPMDGRYKHGLHIHFPNLHVKVDQARQLRMSLFDGLAARSWCEEFGEAHPDWERYVDGAVYDTGLRMLGAPKAKKCPECRSQASIPSCGTCRKANGSHIIDKRAYQLWRAYSDGQPSEALYSLLKGNKTRQVKKTSVRCNEKVPETPGYVIPPGERLYTKATSRGKRPRNETGSQSWPKADANYYVITNSTKLSVLKKYLCRLSSKYSDCAIHIAKRYDVTRGKGKRSDTTSEDARVYRVHVDLVGHNNKYYCLNKRDFHKNNRVYMLVAPSNAQSGYSAYMKCYCKCPVARSGQAHPQFPDDKEKRHPNIKKNVRCSDFDSIPAHIDDEDVRILFPTIVDDARADMKMENANAPDYYEGMYLAKQLLLPFLPPKPK